MIMTKTFYSILILLLLASCENRKQIDIKSSKTISKDNTKFNDSFKKEKNSSPHQESTEKETIKLGEYECSTKDLNVKSFKNGDPIKKANSREEWLEACRNNISAFYLSSDSNGNEVVYYNWHCIKDERGLAPEGWYIPSRKEFEKLVDIIGYETAGRSLKSSFGWKEWEDNIHCSNCKNMFWIKPSERGKHNGPCGKVKKDGNGTNSSNFNGQPNGYVYWGKINSLGSLAGYWMMGTEPWSFQLSSHNTKAEYHPDGYKEIGYNVRCFKENREIVLNDENTQEIHFGNDQNGNQFKYIQIGKTYWMAENLNVDKFRNGDLIKQAKTAEEWRKASANREPAWCYYNNDPANGLKYGKLYNSYACTDRRGLAPFGWHIPSDDEWSNMIGLIGGFTNETGKKMKLNKGWLNRGNGTNEIGFSGLPGGARRSDGVFQEVGEVGLWWSMPRNSLRGETIYQLSSYLERVYVQKSWGDDGFSIRCVKD